MPLSRVLLYCSLIFSVPASADFWSDTRKELQNSKADISLHWANDILFDTDESFTNGVSGTVSFQLPAIYTVTEGDTVTIPNGRFEFSDEHCDLYTGADEIYALNYGLTLGNMMYTPSDISLPASQVNPNDRPYAGWAFAEVFREQIHYPTTPGNTDTGSYHKHAINVGCIGPCARGKAIQTAVHKLINYQVPKGWDRQVRDELTFMYSYTYRPPVRGPLSYAEDSEHRGYLALDFSPSVQAHVGNIYTGLNLSAALRVGLPTMRPYRASIGSFNSAGGLSHDAALHDPVLAYGQCKKTHEQELAHTTQTTLPPISTSRPGGWLWSDEAWAFFKLGTNLVAYDATLQGGIFDRNSPHTVEPRRVIISTTIGVNFQWEDFSIAFSRTARTGNTKNESWRDGLHRWGNLQFKWRF